VPERLPPDIAADPGSGERIQALRPRGGCGSEGGGQENDRLPCPPEAAIEGCRLEYPTKYATVPSPTKTIRGLVCMGWAEGFEPSATGTTIRRSTKLSYAHREGLSYRGTSLSYQGAARPANFNGATKPYRPDFFHNSSTRRFMSAGISITPGQGRVNPSPGHLRVASIPIFEP
jgi:hypothetical protein